MNTLRSSPSPVSSPASDSGALSLFLPVHATVSLSLSVCLYLCLSCSPYNGDGSIVTVASAVPQLHSCAAVPAEPKVESAFSCPDMSVCLCVCLSGCRLADFCQRLADAVADCLSNCESSRAKPKTGKLANRNCNCSNRDCN